MSSPNTSDIENLCRELFSALQGGKSWKWDGRFETVLVQFSVDREDMVRSILNRYFSIAWNNSNIGNAPDIVKMFDNRLGGLKANQLLFSSGQDQDAPIFCAWWPWKRKNNISIRIAPSYSALSESEKAGFIKLFKEWCGI
jgi:hypothetical protein